MDRNFTKSSNLAMRTLLLPLVLALPLVMTGCASPPTGPPGQVLEDRIFIKADYDAVWYRFTNADAYAAWYSSPCREFGSRPGDECIWGDEQRLFYRGRLLSMKKGRGLTHSFRFVGFGFDEPDTRVDIGIERQGEVVLVTVRHDCRNAPKTAAMITPIGWQKSLSRLKTLLETGRAMPWPAEPR